MSDQFKGLTRLGRAGGALQARARSGVSQGGFPRISLNSRGFLAKSGDMAKHVGDINKDTGTQCMECIILDVAPYEGTAKVYYAGTFSDDSKDAPDCSSDNGVRPDSGANRQSESCATCFHNTWGSAPARDGKPSKGKACADQKWLAIVIPGKVDKQTVFRLTVPPASTGRFATYVDAVANMTIEGQPVDMAELITQITHDPNAQGRLLFDAIGMVDDVMPIEEVSALITSDAVKIALRTNTTPALAAPEPVKQIAARPGPVGQVPVTVKEAAPAPAPTAAVKAASPAFKARVAGLASAREAVAETPIKAKPALARKAGPLTPRPDAEDVPTPTNFGMAKAGTPSGALASALSMLDLEDDK